MSILLAVIYLLFISLGLSDSLLGSSWPAMYPSLRVSVSWAGILSMIIAGGSIISSLLCDRLIRELRTGATLLGCAVLSTTALIGYSISSHFWQLCLWSVLYGISIGIENTAINNYVITRYKSRYVNWLHCVWGVGSAAGPYIISYCLTNGSNWNTGYRFIGIIYIGITIMMVMSLPLWKHSSKEPAPAKIAAKKLSARHALHLPRAKAVLLSFFCYHALQVTAGLWASSYLVLNKGFSENEAARWTSLFYLGITFGRLVCGFVSDRLGDTMMIRAGQALAFLGTVCLLLPLGNGMAFTGLMLIGAGCAPILPSLLHKTPDNFGKENVASIMGPQMASANVGSTFMPPLFGALSGLIGIWFYPVYLLFFILLMTFLLEWVNRGQKENADNILEPINTIEERNFS